jgi:hypothetical protein
LSRSQHLAAVTTANFSVPGDSRPKDAGGTGGWSADSGSLNILSGAGGEPKWLGSEPSSPGSRNIEAEAASKHNGIVVSNLLIAFIIELPYFFIPDFQDPASLSKVPHLFVECDKLLKHLNDYPTNTPHGV